MPKIQTLIIAEVDPTRPVPEALALIDAILRHNNPVHEDEILLGIKDAIEKLLAKKKGVETDAE